jgi:uncharacterized protein
MSTVAIHPNAEVVQGFYDALKAGDMDAVARLFSDDISVVMAGASPLAGRYDGPDAVFGFLGRLVAATNGTYRAELRELYPNESQVVAVHHGTGTRGDAVLDAEAALVFTVKNGQITSTVVHQRNQDDWDAFFTMEGDVAGTPGEHPNAALVRAGYEAFNTGDVDTLTSLFSPDITLLQPGKSRLSGLYDGRDAVFGFFGALAEGTNGTFRAELHELYTSDDQVVAVHTATASRGDDALRADAALVFELTDGVVTAITIQQRRQEEWDEFWG